MWLFNNLKCGNQQGRSYLIVLVLWDNVEVENVPLTPLKYMYLFKVKGGHWPLQAALKHWSTPTRAPPAGSCSSPDSGGDQARPLSVDAKSKVEVEEREGQKDWRQRQGGDDAKQASMEALAVQFDQIYLSWNLHICVSMLESV